MIFTHELLIKISGPFIYKIFHLNSPFATSVPVRFTQEQEPLY